MSREFQLNKTEFIAFKKLYEKAVKSKKKSFIFERQQMVTGYAKYVIQYLESKLKTDK